jgi:two-component system, cell cycle response regulator
MSARILVVDDVEINVKLLGAKLASEYFDVLTASNGPAALDLVAKELPDLILLDVMMPGMDGFEVCRRLRARPTLNHVRIVAMTGFPSPENVERIMAAGANACLPKPLDSQRLLAELGLGTGESVTDEE